MKKGVNKMTITRYVGVVLCTLVYLLPGIVKAEEHVVNAAAREFKPAIIYVQPGDTVKFKSLTKKELLSFKNEYIQCLKLYLVLAALHGI